MKKLGLMLIALVGMVGLSEAQFYGAWYGKNPTFTNTILGGWLRVGGTLDVSGTSTFSSSVTVKSNLGATNNIIVAQDMTSNFVNASSMTITRNVAGVTGLFINNNSADAAARVGVYLTDGSVIAGRFQYAKFYNNINFDSLVSGNNFGISTLGSATKITLSPNGVAELDAYAGRVEIPHTLSATNVNFTSGTVTTTFSVGGLRFKGQSFEAALLLVTPELYDVYWASDTWKLWIATGATPAGFKCSAAFGATP